MVVLPKGNDSWVLESHPDLRNSSLHVSNRIDSFIYTLAQEDFFPPGESQSTGMTCF